MTYVFKPLPEWPAFLSHVATLRSTLGISLVTNTPMVLDGANLQGAWLVGADLDYAKLSHANLRVAELYQADLESADLNTSNLLYANLGDACLRGATLRYSLMRGANLQDSDLSSADLTGANLSGCSMVRADLRMANLTRANLYGADLRGARLDDADFTGTNLEGILLGPTRNVEAVHPNIAHRWGITKPRHGGHRPGAGRPAGTHPPLRYDKKLTLATNDGLRESWQQAANLRSELLSVWIRRELNRAASRQTKRHAKQNRDRQASE